MSFKLPILDILDQIKDNGGTLLDKVILHLYNTKTLTIKAIAAVIGVSEATVHDRIPGEKKKRLVGAEDLQKKLDQIKEMHAEGAHPKLIAFDLDLPLHKVYKALQKLKAEKEIKSL